jgi:hypothetical protein
MSETDYFMFISALNADKAHEIDKTMKGLEDLFVYFCVFVKNHTDGSRITLKPAFRTFG